MKATIACQKSEHLNWPCLEFKGESHSKMCTCNTMIHNVLKPLNTIPRTYNQVLITTLQSMHPRAVFSKVKDWQLAKVCTKVIITDIGKSLLAFREDMSYSLNYSRHSYCLSVCLSLSHTNTHIKER